MGGKYEKMAQNVGRRNGHAVILEKERGGTLGQRFTEGTWDGMLFEVAGRETATENNIFKGLKHCAKKRTTQIAVLVYPNGGFDEGILESAIKRYKGLEKLREGEQYLPFIKVICTASRTIKLFMRKPSNKRTGGSSELVHPRHCKYNTFF